MSGSAESREPRPSAWHGRRRAAVCLALALAYAGCGSPGSSALSSQASPTTSVPTSSQASSSASQRVAFVSERYGYAVDLLPGWFVRDEGGGKWYPERDLNYVGAGTDSFELDYEGRGTVKDFPGITYGLYVSSAPAEAGTTLEEWTDVLAETMHRESSCQDAPEREQVTAGGEPAVLLVYDRTDCTHDHHIFIVSVLRGDWGFSIMWLARRGEHDARRADFERTLRTFRFTR